MDKVKVALALLKKYHFWVLCLLVLVITLTVWAKATADLAQQFDARKTQLDGSFTAVDGVCAIQNHPNEAVIAGVEKDTDQLKKVVFVAWETLYNEQKDKNKLADDLTDDFKQEFYKGGELKPAHLEQYQNFILKHFDTLFNDVLDVYREAAPGGATNSPTGPGPAGAAPGGGAGALGGGLPAGAGAGSNRTEVPMTGTVVWSGRNELVSRYNWPARPTTEKVRMAQEDLWVYEALLRVIRNTNADVVSAEPVNHRNAAVKEIKSLQIGSDTFPPTSVGVMPGQVAQSTAGRYVDGEGQPLSEDAPQAAEYKIMPIQMELVMSPSRIPKLQVECANSNMPIEIRRVRIRPGAGAPFNMAGVAGAEARSPSARKGEASSVGQSVDEDLPVEIQGVIYIYNPPDSEKLGTGAVAPATPAEAADARGEPAGRRARNCRRLNDCRASPGRGWLAAVSRRCRNQAMKVKLNLDKATIRAFFLHHTEKIVFGGVVLCFVFMVYVALSRAGFDRTPDGLSALRRTRRTIGRPPPGPRSP